MWSGIAYIKKNRSPYLLRLNSPAFTLCTYMAISVTTQEKCKDVETTSANIWTCFCVAVILSMLLHCRHVFTVSLQSEILTERQLTANLGNYQNYRFEKQRLRTMAV